MSDLNVKICFTCPDNLSWETVVSGSDKLDKYVVSFDGKDYNCTCAGFKYGKTKKCKHIRNAKKLRCTWNWEAFNGVIGNPNDGKCPRCGQKVETVKIGA